MAFFKKGKSANYSVLPGYAWYVPGVSGMFALLGWLLVGTLLGGILASIFQLAFSAGMEYAELISYPVMFIPPMIVAKHVSQRNMLFETGYELDSAHFGKLGGWVIALCCMIATIGASFCMDAVNAQLPEMPEWLEEALKSITEGDFFTSFLLACIFAPFFEEWLCRGMVLRGLLNYKKADGTRGLKPVWAIFVSAFFFAFIHFNPWQGLPAFALGLLFGYVYYKTGSLKLTMLMHFTNNFAAVLVSQLFSGNETMEAADSWLDVVPTVPYVILFVVFVCFIAWFVMQLDKIPQERLQGNHDEIPVEAEELPA